MVEKENMLVTDSCTYRYFYMDGKLAFECKWVSLNYYWVEESGYKIGSYQVEIYEKKNMSTNNIETDTHIYMKISLRSIQDFTYVLYLHTDHMIYLHYKSRTFCFCFRG